MSKKAKILRTDGKGNVIYPNPLGSFSINIHVNPFCRYCGKRMKKYAIPGDEEMQLCQCDHPEEMYSQFGEEL